MNRKTPSPLLKGAVAAGVALLGMKAYVAAKAARSTLATIDKLDVARYMGTWYEIARFPNRFERKCAGDTTATYTALPDGSVKVENRCRRHDGGSELAQAIAHQVGGPDSPKLRVRFAPAALSFIPLVWGDYWIVDLDPAYSLAAVSEPGRDYLWILSRTPRVEQDRYEALLARLAAQGLEVDRLQLTPQA
ncbi:lipocalin family protein [Massilia sp. 9I]|uniref:lipocalin family protein n=1 Tax=Massilia sp. 9I TaxID=2653152 RepID=UPI0012F44B8A|nr:lipocalin family protein [Massilia sp. 9I]VXB58099.1 Outer membrane lipoprotein Blc [Massilia sp. 9I]